MKLGDGPGHIPRSDMNKTVLAAAVGAAAGAAVSLPAQWLLMSIVRKGSNVLLLAPPDQAKLEEYARAFGAPVPDGVPTVDKGKFDFNQGQYL